MSVSFRQRVWRQVSQELHSVEQARLTLLAPPEAQRSLPLWSLLRELQREYPWCSISWEHHPWIHQTRSSPQTRLVTEELLRSGAP
jgi:hypothetical protein